MGELMIPLSFHPRRHMLEGTFRVFLAEALLLPTGLLTAAFLTRRLGPGGYGLFTLATTVVVWIELNISSVFARATVKFIGEAEDWRTHRECCGAAASYSERWRGVCPGHAVWSSSREGPIGRVLTPERWYQVSFSILMKKRTWWESISMTPARFLF